MSKKRNKSKKSASSKSTVVFLGGMYGSGKSTTAERIQEYMQDTYQTALVDYDTLIGNGMGKAVDVAYSEAARKAAWNYGLLDAVQARIHEGYEVILVPGTFSTRERRERFLTH